MRQLVYREGGLDILFHERNSKEDGLLPAVGSALLTHDVDSRKLFLQVADGSANVKRIAIRQACDYLRKQPVNALVSAFPHRSSFYPPGFL